MKKMILFFLVGSILTAVASADQNVRLKMDTSEADAVLAILEQRAAGKAVTEQHWQKLFTSEPYIRLKKREASFHHDFSDEDFKRFVMSNELAQRGGLLRQTLEKWKKADLLLVGNRILPYLLPNAQVKASVYPVIKPITNSFVFETRTNPAIFLYLDPEESEAQFENVIAHECHHLGFSDSGRQYDEKIKSLPENARKAADWMPAFGEGLAMLAAAGSPDVSPIRDYKEEDRIRWDLGMKDVNDQLDQLNQFFVDVIDGGFAKPEVADHVAMMFYGYRGPWYTVGYRMGQLVEKRFGRSVLIECIADPRQLLSKYNQAAEEANASGKERLPTWSPEVLKAVSRD